MIIWDGWMASPTRRTWVWVNSGRWWWTGRPGVLQFMGLQRVRHGWATELNWRLSQSPFFVVIVYHEPLLSVPTCILLFHCCATNGWSRCCSVAKSCLTLYVPMDCSTSGFPVLHYLLELVHTHIHWVCHAIQPSHPLSPTSPPALNPSQHQSLFQWVNSSHQVAKVLEFQL